MATDTREVKHAVVREKIRSEIQGGTYRHGDRLPTETELCQRFHVSRPTVGRALSELQREGLVERIAGSGTYVQLPETSKDLGLLGLVIPSLGETEIFEPICGQMAEAAGKQGLTLLWGASGRGPSQQNGEEAKHLCHSYIEQDVKGVFFAPLEFDPNQERVNLDIVQLLNDAHIPMVLLDRDLHPFPYRSGYDLVGVNNYRAGYLLTQHLLRCGAQRVDFVMRSFSAPTVERRIAGYREALLQADIPYSPSWVHCGDPDDAGFVSALCNMDATGMICANDATAASLITTLDTLGKTVPEDVRVAGFDDVKYAKHLRSPLTTMRQPCRALGEIAMETMLNRISNPDVAPRHIQLECELIVRASCGATL